MGVTSVREGTSRWGETPADFLEFAHARSDQLFRTACLLTGDRHLAEDLVQETLAKMYRSWGRIDRTRAPVAYAHTVLVRTFVSHRRRRSAREQPVDRLPEGDAGVLGDPDLRLTLLDGRSDRKALAGERTAPVGRERHPSGRPPGQRERDQLRTPDHGFGPPHPRRTAADHRPAASRHPQPALGPPGAVTTAGRCRAWPTGSCTRPMVGRPAQPASGRRAWRLPSLSVRVTKHGCGAVAGPPTFQPSERRKTLPCQGHVTQPSATAPWERGPDR